MGIVFYLIQYVLSQLVFLNGINFEGNKTQWIEILDHDWILKVSLKTSLKMSLKMNTWFEIDSNLIRNWFEFGSKLIRIWFEIDLNLIRNWIEIDSKLIQN